jgi:hypothetical protein
VCVTFLPRFGVDTVVVSPGDDGPPPWSVPAPAWSVDGPFEPGHVVLRLRDAGELRYGPFPPRTELQAVPRAGWTAQASYPGAERAIDGDRRTSWTTGEPQGRGDFLRVRFGRGVDVARVSIGAGEPYEFPMHVKLIGQSEAGEWTELAFDERAAYDGLFSSLLYAPRDAALALDLDPPRRLIAIRLRITETDEFWMPWTVPELDVYSR